MAKLTNEQIAGFFTHYGEVSAVGMTFKVGELLLADEELQKLEMSLNELIAKDKGVEKSIEKESCYWLLGRLVGWLYWLYVVGSCAKGAQAEEDLRAQIRRKRAYIEDLKRELRRDGAPLACLGEAVVTFSYGSHASNCMRDQHRPTYRRIYEFMCCNREHPPKFLDRYRLQISRAPEPADILWKNMDVVGANKRQRNFISFIGSATAIAAGLGIQVALERIKEARRNDMRERERENEGSFGDVFHPLTVFAALSVILINFLVASVVRYLTDNYERPHTRNGREKRLVWKLTMVYLVNGGILPLIAIHPRNWFVPGGLVDQAFYIQVLQAIVPFLYAVVNPYYTFMRDFMAYHSRTQELLDKMLMPEEFVIAEQYAIVMNSLGLAFIYAPALPISNLICLAGICLLYWTDKYVALRRCKVPKHLEEDVTNMVNLLLLFLPLAQILMAYLVYYQGLQKPKFFLPFLVGIIAWVAYVLFPFTTMFKLRRMEEFEDSGSGWLSYREACGLRNAADNDLDFTATTQLAHYSPFFRSDADLIADRLPLSARGASFFWQEQVLPPYGGMGQQQPLQLPGHPMGTMPQGSHEMGVGPGGHVMNTLTQGGQEVGGVLPGGHGMPTVNLPDSQDPFSHEFHTGNDDDEEIGGLHRNHRPAIVHPIAQPVVQHIIQPAGLQHDRHESLVQAAAMVGPSGIIQHSGPHYPPQMPEDQQPLPGPGPVPGVEHQHHPMPVPIHNHDINDHPQNLLPYSHDTGNHDGFPRPHHGHGHDDPLGGTITEEHVLNVTESQAHVQEYPGAAAAAGGHGDGGSAGIPFPPPAHLSPNPHAKEDESTNDPSAQHPPYTTGQRRTPPGNLPRHTPPRRTPARPTPGRHSTARHPSIEENGHEENGPEDPKEKNE
ncbi:hypothetical protein CBR_g51015 [Chara braunii]|uniref:CSC1/OSCA1-like cytosolic domain-containing protein n=1 Tax=Chara braunii TaxID=69332 RepID=A0A388M7U9_CHABU|nr:hypothetical protein CBR_g51015 [Chara braunii]|eukprot:GBG90667.1 hypothetical protein CBR_g51015 [Chara braunii]